MSLTQSRFLSPPAPLVLLSLQILRMLLGDSRLAELRAALSFGRVLLLMGESGAGQSVLAQTLHAEDAPDLPMMVCNCAYSLGESPVSVLFGGAGERPSTGLVSMAKGGVVFVDHAELISDADWEVIGSCLLRSNRASGRSVRWIFSFEGARLSLLPNDAVGGGLEGLSPLSFQLPPLRAAREKIPGVAQLLMSQLNKAHGRNCGLTDQAVEYLIWQPWPENLSQLRTVLHRACEIVEDGDIEIRLIESLLAESQGAAAKPAVKPLSAWEKEAVLSALVATGWNKEAASRSLGISKATLYRKIAAYRIPGDATA